MMRLIQPNWSNNRQLGSYVPQGLKPARFLGPFGTTEVVPCYKALGLDGIPAGANNAKNSRGSFTAFRMTATLVVVE
jgi:hypothetical protein